MPRVRSANEYEIDRKILDEADEVYIAPHWYCEACAGLVATIIDLGYCQFTSGELREEIKTRIADNE